MTLTEQIPILPHSTGELHQPLGFIPVLYDTSNSPHLRLTESFAILRYLERVQPLPALFTPFPDVGVPERIDELVSFAATHLFPAIEHGVVKKRLALLDAGEPNEATIDAAVKEGMGQLRPVLKCLEQMLEAGGGPYAVGLSITAADLFLWPPVADLLAIKEGAIVNGYVRVRSWATFLAEQDVVQSTSNGTLADGGRP